MTRDLRSPCGPTIWIRAHVLSAHERLISWPDAAHGIIGDIAAAARWWIARHLGVSTRKVGGIRFLKVGRLTVSWCVSRRRRPFRPARQIAPMTIVLEKVGEP